MYGSKQSSYFNIRPRSSNLDLNKTELECRKSESTVASDIKKNLSFFLLCVANKIILLHCMAFSSVTVDQLF